MTRKIINRSMIQNLNCEKHMRKNLQPKTKQPQIITLSAVVMVSRSCNICLSCSQAMWKPAYDFLVTWAAQIGDSYRDVIQELHMGLDKMKSPITKRWKHLTGTLILVNCLDVLRSSAFSPAAQDDYAI
ncbi:hypothetical protein ATANTOWER_028169 [Ataeniobius toweri]|uniref:SH3BP4 C-terminal helical domain-containing protein n=1 Tax=Ataeniobius toweri TaxID=208326 RepID=A0ABU7B8V0_9TELE|nr:hypothetical protein [Ataeniobius toweri]